MLYVVNVSGGLTSYEALRRCLDAHGKENTVAVFADTRLEDADLYRFLDDQERYLGIQITRIADGRTPFQVWRDERCITMQSAAPCSKILKRQLIDRWVRENVTAEHTRVFGLDWSEMHRVERITKRLAPSPVWCPVAEKPYVTKANIRHQLRGAGIKTPRLYLMGFKHNNCGGGCVNAGQGQWDHTRQIIPEVYARWEQEEQDTREYLGKDVAIMRETVDGVSRPLTLREFRERREAGEQHDGLWGNCTCFFDDL